jgi:predicted amidophosphoribosyltransferase
MSGGSIRKEPICLNCGRDVTERFCTNCGQENIEPRENFRSLLTHFLMTIHFLRHFLLKDVFGLYGTLTRYARKIS